MSEGRVVQTTKTSQQLGDTSVNKETVVASNTVDRQEFKTAKTNQIIWLFIHLIAILIGLRIVFLLLGANMSGFASIIYNLSQPFVVLFQGIFPAARANGSYFDSAAILALVVWYLLGFIITYIINVVGSKKLEA
jgi:hypothetical protein